MTIRDRVRELRRVRASELVPHPKNWRRHPATQGAALRGLLAEIGYADALIARELPDGRLGLIDGHLRAETTPDMEVPVLVLDVTEEEADKILLTLDPLAGMAERDDAVIKELLARVSTQNESVRSLLDSLKPPSLPDTNRPSLAERFLVPPFSVLDARQGYWQERKRAWLALGIESEVGRGGLGVTTGANTFSSSAMAHALEGGATRRAGAGQIV